MNINDSQLIKVKQGPIGPEELTYEQATAALSAAGWDYQVLGKELYCHGLQSNDFTHTYLVTLLCTRKEKAAT